MSKKQSYIKKDPISHILDRPDMYVGSTRSRNIQEYVVIDDDFNIEKRTINISPAILRIFVEPLSNAIDNVARSKASGNNVTKISVNIDEKTGETSIWNDGDIIPIEINQNEKCYNHTLIFGQLLTSSNYDDSEDREDISGRNGIGGKACLKKGTLVPTFNGDFVKVEDLKIGDHVIGDDGNPRKILAKTQGISDLYQVSQKFGENYIVNENHILTLKLTNHKKIFWNAKRNGFSVFWVDKFKNKNKIYMKNINVSKDYVCISCDKIIAKDSIDTHFCPNKNIICELDQETVSFARFKLESFINNIQDDNTIDISVKDYLSLPENIKNLLEGFKASCVNWEENKSIYDPYNFGFCLLKNKDIDRIPKELLINSKKNRKKLLFGILDSCKNIENDFVEIRINYNKVELLSDITFLIKSLGLDYKYEDQGIYNIIHILQDKNDILPYYLSERVSDSINNIKVRKLESDEYIGIQVDGNNRFALEDFTVTHNCNIFSKEFIVEGADPENKKLLIQKWSQNMKKVDEPSISKLPAKIKKGYTKITYYPDFKQFGIESYTPDIISLYKRYIVDTAMITKIPVYYNDVKIPVASLVEYSKLYSKNDTETLFIKTKDCEVVISSTTTDSNPISFANGVYTPLGGTHVDSWSEAFYRPLLEKLNKPKKPQLNISDVKKYFRLFIVATVKKPEFDSQSKTKLENPQITADVKRTHIATISKWSVMENLEDMIRAKEMVVLKKSERKKRGYERVEGLDPANNEGTSKSSDCTLILVEGLSAKTYASWGIQKGAFGKSGRDWFGMYALRGKCLNVRNANPVSIGNNAVITDIIKCLGIQYGLDYSLDENYKKLRYGRLMIITDSDVDGLHISGLIQNMFYSLFPSLLRRDPPFLTSMQTPIVRVYEGKNDKLFYDEREFKKYVSQNPNKKINKKYYKGLGSSNEKEVMETFGKKLVEFREDENTLENMNKAFNSKHSDQRKVWLENYDPNNVVLKWNENIEEKKTLTFSEFINTELIKFSIDDCKRSIPSLVDGLKEGHRKVLFVSLLRNLRYNGSTIKVAQLAGSVSEKSGYHHGEKNLEMTITNMANAYVGSNNIPLLFRDGIFGSRQAGGHDASAGRYIWTKLDALTRLIFREEDDQLLDHNEDDGEKIEPRFYIPIIPMILVNGCLAGIGTGWSCSIPCYNPLDLVLCIKTWLNNGNKAFDNNEGICISYLPDIKPWYRGHKGDLVLEEDGKYISWGVIEQEKNKVVVRELPIGYWTNDFTEDLEKLKEEKQISDYKNYSTPKDIHYVITETDDGIKCNLKNLKLSRVIRTSNMVLFNTEGKLQKYNSVEEIIDDFCKVRFEYYIKRKDKQLKDLEREIKILGNKKRFLQEVRDGDFKLFEEKANKKESRKTVDIIKDLELQGYDRDIEKEEVDNEEKNSGYEYLLRLQINSITAEKINKLKNDFENRKEDFNTLKSKSIKDLWINDLEEFEKAYIKWLPIINDESQTKKKK